MLTEENGILIKAQSAKEENKKSNAKEMLKLLLQEIKINVISEENRETIVEDCEKLKEKDVEKIEYVEEEGIKYCKVTYEGYIFLINNKLDIVDQINFDNDEDTESDILYESYKINKTTLYFKKIIVVGENEEIKTLTEGLDYLLNEGNKNNVAIVLKPGTYDTKDFHSGTSYNINKKYNGMSVSIIADKPGNTYMTSGEMNMSEINKTYGIELKFYRIIFTTKIYGNGFNMGGDIEKKEYYNCVFLPSVGGWKVNVPDSVLNTYNCLFLGGANQYYSAKDPTGLAQNCASKDDKISPKNGTKETCLTDIEIDENYRITSTGWEHSGTGTNPDGTQANIGVYGGKYSW